MSETREAGLYWVGWVNDDWADIAEFADEGGWLVIGDENEQKPTVFHAIGPRVQTPAEIAAAIAAARAECVALGAANMRETCRDTVWNADDRCDAMDKIDALALPTDADAILRAERVKGAEAMRKWCAREVRRQGHDGLATSIDYADILEVLP